MIKIPLNPHRFTILNNFDGDPRQMFDGIVNVDPVIGYGQLLNPFEIWYEFPDAMKAVIEKVRYYNRYDMPVDKALEIYGITAEDAAKPGPWRRQLICKIHKHTQLSFKEIDVTNIAAKYLVFKTWASGRGQSLPDELEFWGSAQSYEEPPITPPASKPFNQFIGINTYEWDLMQNREYPWAAAEVYEPNWEPMKHFTNFRHYWGWKSLEHEEGVWNFQPSRMGNWGYDEFYKRLSSEGRIVWPCIKGLPEWMTKTWNEGEWHHEGAPRKKGTDGKDPAAYVEYARSCFQVCARYGNNKNVDPALVKAKTWNGTEYLSETPKVIGLGYIKYIEILNEADAWWWNGRAGYMLPEEYGALLSAVWDGDRGRLGAGVGISQLGVKLIVAGSAQPTVDWHKGLVRWWAEFRGDELPVSVWNYHLYSNDYNIKDFAWTPGQGSRGVAPELGRLPWAIQRFTEFNQTIGGNREIWVTESGYDLAQTSPQKAIAIGNRTPEQVQADWLLRTALLLSAGGHDRLTIYQLYDDNNYGGLYGSSGVVNKDQSPRLALQYLARFGELIGDYRYDATVSESPRVDRYVKDGAVARYVAWMPTEEDLQKVYQVNISRQFRIKLYELEGETKVSYPDNSFIDVFETPCIFEIEERPLIYVQNALPIADAGRDYEVKAGTTATLTAADSIDVDGTVKAWKWTKISGPRYGKISYSTRRTTTLTGLVPGTYKYRLTVTDDKNGTATDEITITVK